MLLLAFTLGMCFGLFVLVALSIFAVGRAFDGATAIATEELARAEIERIQKATTPAANDPDFRVPDSILAPGGAQEAATGRSDPPPPPTPQPPEVRPTGAILARSRCRFCSKIRSLAAKLRN